LNVIAIRKSEAGIGQANISKPSKTLPDCYFKRMVSAGIEDAAGLSKVSGSEAQGMALLLSL
jgi:hypothetical protein